MKRRFASLILAAIVLALLGAGTALATPRVKQLVDNATGGDCTSIGLWNRETKTCTLTTDVGETIQIDSSGITLDGANHTVWNSAGTSPTDGSGVYVLGRDNVTIKNCNLFGSSGWGVLLVNTHEARVDHNGFGWNGIGLEIRAGSGNVVTRNGFTNNDPTAILVAASNNNRIYNNLFTSGTIVASGSGNVFNVAAPLGGNYYGSGPFSNCPNANADEFCDTPVTFQGGQDNLPWARIEGWLDYPFHIRADATGGDCTVIGYWSAASKTCTLKTDVRRTVIIDSDGIVFDGKMYNITARLGNEEWNDSCLLLRGHSNITVKNTKMVDCALFGIFQLGANAIVTDNWIHYSMFGVDLGGSRNALIKNNTISNNMVGITAAGSSGATITNNTILENESGAFLAEDATRTRIYNNNFLGAAPIQDNGTTLFSLPAPIGGNYWSSYATPAQGCSDLNGDRFCDAPYHLNGNQDALPWAVPGGWRNTPPDIIPPTVTDNAPEAWQKANFTVVLTCTDNPGGSGCREPQYSTDRGWHTGTRVDILTEGDTTILYSALDKAGNLSDQKSTHARLDKTLPVVTITSPQAKSYSRTAKITVNWTASDALSGLAGQKGTLDGKEIANGQLLDLSLLSVGPHTFAVQATDKAGNTRSQSITFQVAAP